MTRADRHTHIFLPELGRGRFGHFGVYEAGLSTDESAADPRRHERDRGPTLENDTALPSLLPKAPININSPVAVPLFLLSLSLSLSLSVRLRISLCSLSFGICPEAHALVVRSAEEKRSDTNRNPVGFQVASSIDRNCCGSYKGISILRAPCLYTKGWFFFPNLMDVTIGNAPPSEKQPVESCKSLEEGKEAVGKDANNSLFVNHAAEAWHESRRKWVGDQTQRSPKMVKDEIISWSTTYEELLSTNEPFSEPIPLPEMVDFLVDIWHSEGLFD